MLHAAMIGGGYIGDCHIAAYQALDPALVTLSAIIDANPQAGKKAAEKAGCRYFETLEQAIAECPVDVVDICVPTFLHEQFAVKAAQAGKHVLCEKPVTLTLESFDRMHTACKENGVKFMTGQIVRFTPEYVEFAARLKAGQLGRLHLLSAKRLCQHPAWTAWHKDPGKSGGGLFDLNTHDIDYIYSLFGLPESVSAVGWKSETGCWNQVATLLRWQDKQAVCETSLEMTGDFPFSVEVRATGDQGTLHYHATAGVNIKDAQTMGSFMHYPTGGAPQAVEVAQYDAFHREIEAFLLAVANDREVPIPPEETRDVLRILIATKEALETGAVVKL